MRGHTEDVGARTYIGTPLPLADLETEGEGAGTGVKFRGSRSLAEHAAYSGLAQWLIDKATQEALRRLLL